MFHLFADRKNRIYRKMGYFADQEGIVRRYRQEGCNWEPHLQKTKEAILKSAELKNKGRAAIIGSGWLLDVPWKELSQQFNELCLIDIKHPATTRHMVRGVSNVTLLSADVSGFAVPLFNMVKEVKKGNTHFKSIHLKPIIEVDLTSFDFVVSCNILNQLDILIVDYLKSNILINLSEEISLRKLIQDTHIDQLPKGKSLLVSDVDELQMDGQNRLSETKSLIHTDKLPLTPNSSWIWSFDNYCTYQSSHNTWFKVKSFSL